MFTPGKPNLSEEERTRSPGVIVVYYADDDDYRCRWFSELDFFDMPMSACCLPSHFPGPCCDDAGGADTNNRRTYGELWEEERPVDINAAQVREWYVPQFLDAMRVTRAAPDEPPHLAYEVYWRGTLVHQEAVDAKAPLPSY